MREADFILTIIAQFPTFVGLLLLAYVQYQDSKRCEESRDRADIRYHDLVKMLIVSKPDAMNIAGMTFRRMPSSEEALPMDDG